MVKTDDERLQMTDQLREQAERARRIVKDWIRGRPHTKDDSHAKVIAVQDNQTGEWVALEGK